MQEILIKLLGYLDRFRGMSVDSLIHLVLLAALAAFGVLNVFLGYRILRFWMMLGGFAIGAGLGYLFCELFELTQKNTILLATAGTGAVLGLIAFFIYRAGIFLIGAGVGMTLSIYVFRPNTSALFFACILAGIALGILAVRFSRPVVILATSVMGGAVSGIAIAKLAKLSEIPYAILIGLFLTVTGSFIQFATNKPELVEEEDDELTDDEEEADALESEQLRRRRKHNPDLETSELPEREVDIRF